MRCALLSALACAAACATAPDRVPNFRLQFGVAQAPTIVLVSPSWSDRGLAMLEQIRRSKRTYPELQVVMVVMDDLPLKAWNVAVKALAVPGVARRSAGLGLDQPPLGPIREVPMIFWVNSREEIIERAVGFIDAQSFDEQTRRLMEEG